MLILQARGDQPTGSNEEENVDSGPSSLSMTKRQSIRVDDTSGAEPIKRRRLIVKRMLMSKSKIATLPLLLFPNASPERPLFAAKDSGRDDEEVGSGSSLASVIRRQSHGVDGTSPSMVNSKKRQRLIVEKEEEEEEEDQ